MRSWLRSIDPNVAVFSDNDVFSAELAGRDRYYTIFSDGYLGTSSLPDLLILSWPPEHFNQGQVDPQSFRKSFVSEESILTSHYRGKSMRYKLIQSFPSEEYGAVTAWARQPSEIVEE
jgi:hypothetical protein